MIVFRAAAAAARAGAGTGAVASPCTGTLGVFSYARPLPTYLPLAQAALSTASQQRAYSSKGSMRGRLVDSIILDRWVPPEKLPFPYNKANAAVVWERIKKFIFATWSVYQVRTTVKGWKPGPFGLETQRMYIEMNKAFAKGDKNELSKYVSDGMLAKLNPEIKSMQRLGEYVWEAHGAATRPHVVHLATAKVALENGEQRLSQVTVRLDVKQSMAIYKNGKLIGGNPNEHKTIVEYVVMEKWLDGRWAETNWKIAGKIPAPSQQASSA